jgi:hypothetical protein
LHKSLDYSYQGILTDASGNVKPDGAYSITFSFYENESTGDPIWTESKNLNIAKGLFSTLLGDQTPFGTNVKFDKPLAFNKIERNQNFHQECR